MAERDAQRDLEICEKATKGPWIGDGYHVWTNSLDILIANVWDEDNNMSANRDFIATAREALPYWIKRAQELEQKLRGAKKTLEKQGRQIKRLKEALADSVVAECMSEQGVELAKLKQENKEMDQEIEVLREALHIACAEWSEDMSEWEDVNINERIERRKRYCLEKAREDLDLPEEPGEPGGEGME